ncbi:uncharacterized protein ACHE_20470A [Aspergillus chevalieri]|uniref:Uncharacterized protein n=1 Tax=Aspergillus chevalieri TaxID=182096 RepID=A0A7R7VII3_ASPCH|nr:uncharacterized protein ACHE_20470A [Aspergillus chevalieri]BCR85012.1 hypothetical protein ACHE_20470A [Aspergillus chevalieri]
MAGAKRKLDTAHAPTASEGASQSANNAQNVRVTRRSAASQANRDPRGSDKSHNNSTTTSSTSSNNSSNIPARRSRIVKLNTRGALANNANTNPINARETRTSRGRATALSSSQQSEPIASAPSQVPETPRLKRMKRGSVAEETPRTTRQSARIRALGPNPHASFDEAVEGKPLEASPTKASSIRANVEDKDDTTAAITKSPSPDEVNISEEPKVGDTDDPEDPKTEWNPAEGTADANLNNDGASTNAHRETPTQSLSPPQKERNSPEAEVNTVTESADVFPTASEKKPKFEETDLDRALEQQLQNGTAEKHDSPSPADATEESRVDDESRQITDVEESVVPNGVRSTARPTTVKGRQAARIARGRAKGKGRPKGKGPAARRAAAAAAAGRGRQMESPELRSERSPSPFAAARKLLDRKLELDRAFKKVAAAQRLALHVMAVRTENQLARDKNAHQKVPEFDKLEAVLTAYRQKRQDILRHEYEFRVEQENLLFTSEQDRLERKFRASARHIQEEHFLAAQGDYMAFVEGRRAAEDDEHTETDGSETEQYKRPRAPPIKEFIRGFNSNHVREPAGAAAYERADTGWEQFVQRVRLGEDFDPQMKEMREIHPSGATNQPVFGTLEMLLEATNAVANQPTSEIPAPAQTAPEMPAVALSALADVASSEGPIRTSRPSMLRTILPQPMTDPRPYMLPRPGPHPAPPQPGPARQQTRPLLPAGQQIPSINEQLGLPDPFVPGGGPPQLPPPPGSNFQRPPPPGFLQSSPLYFPPPHHPSGPRPPY